MSVNSSVAAFTNKQNTVRSAIKTETEQTANFFFFFSHRQCEEREDDKETRIKREGEDEDWDN